PRHVPGTVAGGRGAAALAAQRRRLPAAGLPLGAWHAVAAAARRARLVLARPAPVRELVSYLKQMTRYAVWIDAPITGPSASQPRHKGIDARMAKPNRIRP